MTAQQGKHLLALAVTANSFGQRPSRLLGILDKNIALQIDTAAALALDKREQEQQKALAQMIAREVWRPFEKKQAFEVD